jgi:phosphatidate cytidylyltransferase
MTFPKINSILKNLIIRAITGGVYVALIVSAIYIHPYGFVALFAPVVGLALWEFYGITGERKFIHKLTGICGGIYLFVASFLYAGGFTSGYIFFPYLLFLTALLVSSLYNFEPNPIKNCAMSLFAQFYCAGLLSTLNFIVFDPATKQYFPYFALLIFIFVWLNDTFAYLTGITLGKHPFFPRISPKKSWEGFWGGFVITLLFSQIIAYYFPEIINWYESLGLAIVTVIFGTYGDLVESLLKRTYGVKDSGRLLPGHGGVLDRFDSVMLAAPAVYIFIALVIRN